MSSNPRILVTGALGQLGNGLLKSLGRKFPARNLVGSDVKKAPLRSFPVSDGNSPTFVHLDVCQKSSIDRIIVEHQIDWIFHYSAILSFLGERYPERALQVNLNGFYNVADACRQFGLRLFVPSTIGVFGADTPPVQVPDSTIMRPSTIYGITKVHAELMGQYYHEKNGLDFRSLRYPGILTSDTEPGGGTTDYAVEIYHAALNTLDKNSVRKTRYRCPLVADARLPMMYADDCIRGTIEMMAAEDLPAGIDRTFNVGALSFTPLELEVSIRAFLDAHSFQDTIEGRRYDIDFRVDYSQTDPVRCAIAATWPQSLDDSRARKVWQWKPEISDVDQLTHKMLTNIASSRGITIIQK